MNFSNCCLFTLSHTQGRRTDDMLMKVTQRSDNRGVDFYILSNTAQLPTPLTREILDHQDWIWAASIPRFVAVSEGFDEGRKILDPFISLLSSYAMDKGEKPKILDILMHFDIFWQQLRADQFDCGDFIEKIVLNFGFDSLQIDDHEKYSGKNFRDVAKEKCRDINEYVMNNFGSTLSKSLKMIREAVREAHRLLNIFLFLIEKIF